MTVSGPIFGPAFLCAMACHAVLTLCSLPLYTFESNPPILVSIVPRCAPLCPVTPVLWGVCGGRSVSSGRLQPLDLVLLGRYQGRQLGSRRTGVV